MKTVLRKLLLFFLILCLGVCPKNGGSAREALAPDSKVASLAGGNPLGQKRGEPSWGLREVFYAAGLGAKAVFSFIEEVLRGYGYKISESDFFPTVFNRYGVSFAGREIEFSGWVLYHLNDFFGGIFYAYVAFLLFALPLLKPRVSDKIFLKQMLMVALIEVGFDWLTFGWSGVGLLGIFGSFTLYMVLFALLDQILFLLFHEEHPRMKKFLIVFFPSLFVTMTAVYHELWVQGDWIDFGFEIPGIWLMGVLNFFAFRSEKKASGRDFQPNPFMPPSFSLTRKAA